MIKNSHKSESIDVLVIGSCNTDLICYVSRLPVPGETITGSNFSVGFGGKGANQCVAAAKLGASCALVSKLGDDTFGKNYIENLEKIGIDIEHVTVCNDSSGVAQICVSANGENSIVIIPGANDKLSCSDIDAAEGLISKAKMVVFQFEIPLKITLYALNKCQKYKCITILNGAPALPNMDSEFLKLSSIFCVNEIEAEAITKISIKTIEDAKASVMKLFSLGCESPVITLGAKGVVIINAETHEPIHITVDPVKNPVDTTGAGDAFIGAMAFYLSKNHELVLEEVVRRSCIYARLSVMKPGTQCSFPYKHEVVDQELTL